MGPEKPATCPLYRRLPKKGFKNARFKKDFYEINIFVLNKFKDGSVVNIDEYKNMGISNSNKVKVKILGFGDLEKKLEVYANKFSKTALEKIEKAGGKAIFVK